MNKPINDLKAHIIKRDFKQPLKYRPPGYYAEISRVIRYFLVNPQSAWLIDRKSEFERIDVNQNAFAIGDIQLLMKKLSDFI